MSDYLIGQFEATQNVVKQLRSWVVHGSGSGRLTPIAVGAVDGGEREQEDAAAHFVMIGAERRTDWLPAAVARDPADHIITKRDLHQAATAEG